MIFRPMHSDDLAAVSELGIRSKSTWGYPKSTMAVFAKELTHGPELIENSFAAIVACVGSQITGYFTLVRCDDDTIELDFMFVSPEFIGQGIGTAMMLEVIRLAVSHDAERLTLTADPNAVGFYQRFGADIVGDHQSSIPNRTIPMMEIALPSVGH